MARGAQPGVVVFDIEARVHARLVVRGRDQAGEHLTRLRLELFGKAVVAPGFAHRRLRAGTIALGEPGARQGEAAFGAQWRQAAEESDGRARVDGLFPERDLGAPAQSDNARPARIGGDEGGVAGKVDVGVLAAQDHPLDELAGERIGNGIFHAGRVLAAAFVGELDRLLDRVEVERRSGRGRGDGERWCGSAGVGALPSRRPAGCIAAVGANAPVTVVRSGAS